MKLSHASILGFLIFAGVFTILRADHFSRLEKNDPSLMMKNNILYHGDHPFYGIEVEHYLNGDLYRETPYENGLKEGRSKEYSLGHVLRANWNYHQGIKEGFQEGWFAEGPKRFEANFKNGILDGVQTEWHQNGTVFKRQVYANGIETDKKVLYPGGEIFTNYSKRDERKYGIDGGALCLEVKREGEK